MPMGNRMGPNGMGPGTGRGAGYCNGFDEPGTYNRGRRGQGGPGMGRGFGRRFAGRGAGYGVQQVSSEELLRKEAEFLESRLNAIREQLKDSEKETE